MHAEDSERRRIAKELHDSTAQDLVAVMMSLDSVRESIAGRAAPEAQLVLFRVVQECLGNIHRHARSPTTAIRICREASALVMEVRDVGCGMPPAVLEAARGSGTGLGVGIPGMSERLRQIGGRLEIESGGQGTTIRVIVPRPQEPT